MRSLRYYFEQLGGMFEVAKKQKSSTWNINYY